MEVERCGNLDCPLFHLVREMLLVVTGILPARPNSILWLGNAQRTQVA